MKPFLLESRIYYERKRQQMKGLGLIVLLFLFTNCNGQMKKGNQELKNEKTVQYIKDNQLEQYDSAVFASGCFWCVEPIFESVDGVVEAISGYAGGHTDFVNYELSNTGKTGHAEAVKVYYDADKVDFAELVKVYFSSHDYTQKNGQGPDRGSQYRSIAFYKTPEQKQVITDRVKAIEKQTGLTVETEVQEFDRFFVAEDYHQNFKENNENHPYIRNVSNPRFKKFEKEYEKVKE